jgi:hypothetical protein
MWAAAQVVRTRTTPSWPGMSAGLLAVCGNGLWTARRPQSCGTSGETNREQLLRPEHRAGQFEFTQFENKILRGELMGFPRSPNTRTRPLVLLGLVVLGACAVRPLPAALATRRWRRCCSRGGVLPLARRRTRTGVAACCCGPGRPLETGAPPAGGVLYWSGASA